MHAGVSLRVGKVPQVSAVRVEPAPQLMYTQLSSAQRARMVKAGEPGRGLRGMP